jgi:hypothetical protein
VLKIVNLQCCVSGSGRVETHIRLYKSTLIQLILIKRIRPLNHNSINFVLVREFRQKLIDSLWLEVRTLNLACKHGLAQAAQLFPHWNVIPCAGNSKPGPPTMPCFLQLYHNDKFAIISAANATDGCFFSSWQPRWR